MILSPLVFESRAGCDNMDLNLSSKVEKLHYNIQLTVLNRTHVISMRFVMWGMVGHWEWHELRGSMPWFNPDSLVWESGMGA